MYQMPNGSARMDAVCASILVDQIASLPDRIERWNALCRAIFVACAARRVALTWFGAPAPHGFTGRFEHRHFVPQVPLPRRSAVLARLFDMRLPLSFTAADGMVISRIIASETAPPTETA